MAESNAINAATTGIVGNTGTGFTGTPLTQYLVNCGGATSSTISQVASTGTAGQVLTSAGAGALPSFQNVSVSGAITSVNIQTFTSNGTYTPTSGMAYCIVEIVGGGGAGGGAAATGSGQGSCGGGGGSGEYSIGYFSSATIGASQSVTIGAGGTGTSGGTGGTGGTTSLGALLTAIGGVGGTAGSAGTTSINNGGSGGTGGTGGNLHRNGNPGSTGIYISGALNYSGQGGACPFGPGGRSSVNIATNGSTPGSYGGGASGAINGESSSARTGASGAPGVILITEYIA